MPPSAVTHILNARHALDLTPRQVAQLDSMERVLWTERKKLRAQIAPQRDSLRNSVRQQVERGARPRQDSVARATMQNEAEARMARIRPQMQALRQRDSTMRIAAERLLTDAQRGRLREMQAEHRGYERGRREAGPRGVMRDGRPGRNQGRLWGGQRPGGRPGAPQGGARPPQRPE
jgi:septal ring factor EnvC (AmiA/AmiB activator)